MLAVEIYQHQIPEAFKRFSEIVGEKIWFDQVGHVNADIARNPLLNEHLTSQNSLVISLKTCSLASAENAGQLPWELTVQPNLIEAFVFIVQMLALVDAATKISKKRARILVSRIRDALKVPTEVHAMQLENRVATHFLSVGHSVRFPELGNGSETFDLLIESLGPNGLEIECKSLTHNKGRKIHRHEAFEFYHLMWPAVTTLFTNLNTGLAVVVTVPARLPKLDELEALVKAVNQQILLGISGMLQDGTVVRLIDFDVGKLGQLNNPPSMESRLAFEEVTHTANRESVFYRAAGTSGLVGLVIQSAQPDFMLDQVFVTIAEAAAKQLTAKRAGALVCTFQDVRREALHDTVLNEGSEGNYSKLSREAGTFLERQEYPHLVAVGFMSAPDRFEFDKGVSSGGSTYLFPQKNSPFWHPDFSGLFGIDPRVKAIHLLVQ